MEFTFLSAAVPLTKRYELDAGTLTKHPWPFVYEVTSHTEKVTSLKALTPLLEKHGRAGHCLLKGQVNRPLQEESRAGTTDRNAKTDWVLLDLDDITGYDDIDAFLQDIGCAGVDYILQWSASSGIEPDRKGFRAHVYMKLDTPRHPQLLKFWLMDLNLKVDTLHRQLDLTRSHNALRWPLDVTTCQNDKLIFLAPPELGKGIKDPFRGRKRIEFVQKERRTLSIQRTIPTRDALREAQDKVINELRERYGLPAKKQTRYKRSGTVEYMANPDEAVITDMKHERGFVYFNLNGGDSWGYFHPEDNPMYIHNFKGEPIYRTEDLLPEYWAGIVDRARSHQPDSHGMIYLAFRDFRTANYYNGTYDTDSGRLTLAQAKSETQLRHFMKQHGQPTGDYIPDWDLVFDPHSEVVVDPQARTVNTFQPSSFMQAEKPPRRTRPPRTIHKVVDHVLGNDAGTVEHFWNWLAWIIQNLDRSETAWLLQGIEGTGKGLLFHHILAPLLGSWNTTAKRMEELVEQFTGFMENKFLVFMDEVEKASDRQQQIIAAKLRNLITEPEISIRKMYAPPYMARNYANLLFASNSIDQIYISRTDRRFNVAPYQAEKLSITQTEVDGIAEELVDFYAFLWHYKADRQQARTALHNDAKDKLIELNLTGPEVLAHVIRNGDLPELVSYLPDEPPSMATSPQEYMKYQEFARLLHALVAMPRNWLTREELMLIFSYCLGSVPTSPNKFTAYAKHYNLFLVPIWNGQRTVRGLEVTWQYDARWRTTTLKYLEQEQRP